MAAGAAELLELVVGPEGDSSFRGTTRFCWGFSEGGGGNFFVSRKARGNVKGAGERGHSLQLYFFEQPSLRFDEDSVFAERMSLFPK